MSEENDDDPCGSDGVTVDTAAGPMVVPWGYVADYFRTVDGWRECVPEHRRRWWRRRRP